MASVEPTVQAWTEASLLLRDACAHLRRAVGTVPADVVGRVIEAMARTSVLRLHAVRLLTRSRAYPEAAILSRSILELSFSAAYIHECPQPERRLRAERFEALDVVQTHALVDRVKRDPMNADRPEWGELSAKLSPMREEAIAAHEHLDRSVTTNWTGIRTWRDVVSTVSDESRRSDLLWMYDFLYFHLSMFAHPTPAGIEHVYKPRSNVSELPYIVTTASITPTVYLLDLTREIAGLPRLETTGCSDRLATFLSKNRL